ncbi:hypothetical protein SLA2020_277360 [Shorea laevis]
MQAEKLADKGLRPHTPPAMGMPSMLMAWARATLPVPVGGGWWLWRPWRPAATCPGGVSKNCPQRDLDDAFLRGASLAARLCKMDGVLAPNAAYGQSAIAN